MNLLRLITWPYARKHRLRWLLTASGISLGVAVLVAMHAANDTVSRSFGETVNQIAGIAQLQISAGDGGFSENVLDVVQSRPGVAVAVPVIEQIVKSDVSGQGYLLILGVDMLGDSSLRKYDVDIGDEDSVEDPLLFLAQPNSLMVTRQFAQENHLTFGTQIRLPAADGVRVFVVRGIMRTSGLARAFGGNLAVMDIYGAQKMFGRTKSFDRIDLTVRDGFTVQDCRADLMRTLGPGFLVEPPAARAQAFDSLLEIYSRTMDLMSLFALLIGVFIIYNSFSIAVAQRRAEIGTLRALGATRRQIRWLFLSEGIAVGTFAAAVGVALGLLIAWGSMKYVAGLIQSVYGVPVLARGLAVSWNLIPISFGVGIVTTMIAAVLPAESAASISPCQSFQTGNYQRLSLLEHLTRPVAAVVLAACAVICLSSKVKSSIFYIGYGLAIIATVFLVPAVVAFMTRALRRPAMWIRPVEGALAIDSLSGAARRTSATVGALMLSLAVLIAMGGISRGSYVAITHWLYTTFNPDLFLLTSPNVVRHNFLVPISLEQEIRSIPGVADVQGVTTNHILLKGSTPTLLATDLHKFFQYISPEVTEGNILELTDLASQGKGVIISESFSTFHNLHLHDRLDIPTPSGTLGVEVVGVIRDFANPHGSLWLDRSLYQQYFKSGDVAQFQIHLQKGASAQAVQRKIVDRFAGRWQFFVLTSQELRSYILGVADQWFRLTYLQILVAVIVALLGITNSLIVSVTDRQRDLAVLQTLGATRGQIRRIVSCEAVVIALISLISGIALGAVSLHYTLDLCRRGLTGIGLPYVFPWRVALLTLPSIFVAAWLASVWPARFAVRGSLVQALSYE